MIEPFRDFAPGSDRGRPETGDRGRAAYMNSIYGQMAGAVLLSAGASSLVAHVGWLRRVLFTSDGLTLAGWIVSFAPLGFVILLGVGINRLSPGAARSILVCYALLVGLSLGGVLMAYTGLGVALAFVAAAAGFVALALVGAATNRDLSGFGAFLTIGLVGLLAAMLLNLFVRSESLDLALSAVGVLIFAGLTAFDVQRLKRGYDEAPAEGRERMAVLGALSLYLDFLNLFLSLLRLTGDRRR